jgi:DNA-binding beta-propeller fold protein YncE
MRRPHVPAGVAVLLLFAFRIHGAEAGSGNDAPNEEVRSSQQFTSLKTYDPAEFQQSLLDRLSGGTTPSLPFHMAANSQGQILVTQPLLSAVYVLDTKSRRRWQINTDRRHNISAPSYISVDADDNIYLTDLWHPTVLVLQPNGQFLRTIGQGILRTPTGVWVDKTKSKLYVADWTLNEVLVFDLEGHLLRSFGGFGSALGQLIHPLDIALHQDTALVLDGGNSRFELFNLQGAARAVWPYGRDRAPSALGCDAVGNFYYADLDSGGLVAMDPQGKIVAGFGQRAMGEWIPRSTPRPNFVGIAVDSLGNILAIRTTFEVEVLKLSSGPTG